MAAPENGAGQTSGSIQQTGDRKSITNDSLPDIDAEIGQLARRITRETIITNSTPNILHPSPGSALDPQCPIFDARAWVKSFVELFDSDPNGSSPRKLGVAFRNLSVFGSNSGAKHQRTAGNVLLDAVFSLSARIGRSSDEKKTPILYNFDGLVNDGELLLVLGPPGSGCSTLLKVVAGETTGLHMSADTKINFRGNVPESRISSINT